MSVRWEAAGATDVGRVRQANEDTFFVDVERGVLLVADGMGGHAAGEVASALAAEAVGPALVDAVRSDDALEAALRASFAAAHEAIACRARDDALTRGMGTTLTACVLTAAGRYHIGHVGDSRAYLLRDGALRMLTRDHTWVQDQIDAGRLTPVRARTHRYAHVITRALGTETGAEPDLLEGPLAPGDLLLLASDGLTGMIPDPLLARILAVPDASLAALLAVLVETANQRGGTDNITAVLARIVPGGDDE